MKISRGSSIQGIINEYLIDSPQPINISYFWNFGLQQGLNQVIMIITGITLAMHYTPNTELAFNSVEHIMRDVNNGWIQRYIHANGASFFFIFVYIHIGRGFYYGSYRSPRGLQWTQGVIIFIVMMAKIDWPSWQYVKIQVPPKVINDITQISSIPFIQKRTRAIKRIGPHNFEVQSRIAISQLGDGWFDRIPSKKLFSYRFNIDLEDKNKEYANFQAKWFYARGYCYKPVPKKIIRKISKSSRQNSKTRIIYRVTLFTHTSFHWLYNGFYKIKVINNKKKRVKIIPRWIGDYMTVSDQANYIMQDGSKQKNSGINIATNCFTYKECQNLANQLHSKFKFRTSVVSAGVPNQWKIHIWKESMVHLRAQFKNQEEIKINTQVRKINLTLIQSLKESIKLM